VNAADRKTGRSSSWSRKQAGFYKGIGERVRAKRLRQNVTQEGLAKLVGLTRTSLTNIEKGRQKILLHTFADLAAALQVEPSDLLPSEKLRAKALLKKAGGG
jgi:transcriptional regulator with XRE-family HTH domain